MSGIGRGRAARAPEDPGIRGTRRGLRAMLGLQIVVALALLVSEAARSIPPGALPSELTRGLPGGERMPGLEAPVAPGDQRRRMTPGPTLPEAGDMPERLRIEASDETLRLTGLIAPGDAARLARWLDERDVGGAAAPVRVALHSTGGSVADALAIGRMLRAREMATVLPAGRLCLSACPYIFAGGVTRIVEDGAALGLHQHYHGESTLLPAFLAVKDIQRGQADVMLHLAEMGVDPMVMVPALSTPPAEIYVLLPEELTRYRMVTPSDTAEAE